MRTYMQRVRVCAVCMWLCRYNQYTSDPSPILNLNEKQKKTKSRRANDEALFIYLPRRVIFTEFLSHEDSRTIRSPLYETQNVTNGLYSFDE